MPRRLTCSFCVERATYTREGPVGTLRYGPPKVPFCAWHLLLLYLGMQVY